jgi:hypothetical protein
MAFEAAKLDATGGIVNMLCRYRDLRRMAVLPSFLRAIQK